MYTYCCSIYVDQIEWPDKYIQTKAYEYLMSIETPTQRYAESREKLLGSSKKKELSHFPNFINILRLIIPELFSQSDFEK